MISRLFLLLSFFSVLFFSSCEKDISFADDAILYFGQDSVHFDTAFTTTTTATQRVKLFNRSNKAVKISRIYFQKGAASYFRMGIDGKTGFELGDIDILAHDSTYIFLTAEISPQDSTVPIYILDSLICETNAGKSQCIIDGFGQDAYIYRDTVLSSTVWTSEKPIVILGDVVVDRNQTLEIQSGTRIYVQQKKYLHVFGTLVANATKSDSIIFQGNRIDRAYWNNAEYPGEWGGIHFYESSHDNKMNHCIIKNATVGIIIDTLDPSSSSYKVSLNKVSIQNCLAYGVLSYNGSLYMENCLLSINNVNLAFAKGGNLYMNACTLAGYAGPRKSHDERSNSRSMILINYIISDNVLYDADLNAEIYNSIIYGSLAEEFTLDLVNTSMGNVKMKNNFLATKSTAQRLDSFTTLWEGNQINVDPNFRDRGKMDFHLSASSPAANYSTFLVPLDDLDDLPRQTPTNLGCYDTD